MEDDVATPGRSGLRDDTDCGEDDPPFLKLPAELRNVIYRYAAVNNTPIQLYLSDVDPQSNPEARTSDRRPLIINLKPHPHPLALTCRKFYAEVRPIYLLENTFCLSNLTTTENLHVEYIEQFRKMICQFVKRLKKVNIDYRFCAENGSGGKIEQRWARLTLSLYVNASRQVRFRYGTNLDMNSDEGGVLRMGTRSGTSADLCYCGLSHLARNHSARASETKLFDFLEAMFNVASGHHSRDSLEECRKCGDSVVVADG
ncbi:hypothetical protein D0865_11327 [Hortaea werneckii]|uniref:F-box domain-containing protein n=1 Tax=Hortaea werneckii TaxID=91943 RepID=A0A3M7BUD0_HORWE|nr:hypothetical protein D0865_11327 [Hortaea werneckii]